MGSLKDSTGQINLSKLDKALVGAGQAKAKINVQDAIARLPAVAANCLKDIEAILTSKGMDSGKFFSFLDDDSSNTVDRKEFVNGVMKMKGASKNIS